MSSCDRRRFLLLASALPLAACGFEPALAPGGPAAGLLERVEVDAPTDRDAFDFVAQMERRIGRASAPIYRLSYRIDTETESQAIAQDNTINRYQVVGTVRYRMLNSATGEELTQGTAHSFTSYSAFGTSVSTAAAEADAHRRLMRLLADQVVTRLNASAAAWNRGA